MQQDRTARMLARISGLRDRLQDEDLRENIPVLYLEEFHEALTGLAIAETGLEEFRVRSEHCTSQGVERTLFLAKLDAAIGYLSKAAKTSHRSVNLKMDGYSLKDLATGNTTDEVERHKEDLKENPGLTAVLKSVPDPWIKIADEVIWRKRLLMAAAQELRERQIPNDFALATVDVFVEKAQSELTTRAEQYRKWGSRTALAALVLMAIAGAALYAMYAPTVRQATLPPGHSTDWGEVLLGLVRASTLGAVLVGAIIYLIFISRALLHEMVVLYQRRHALRFGRLFIYLHPEDISVVDLQAAFNWNAEYRSAFKDIRADKIVQLPTGKTVEFATELADMVRELARQAPKKD